MKNSRMNELFGCFERMKQFYVKRPYAIGALGLLALTGCGLELDESDYKFDVEEGAKVTFSAVIDDNLASQLAGTRATETDWEVGDTVGITCGSAQVNVKYRYTGGTENYFEAVDNTNEIWVMGSETYEVSAYYPYTGEDDSQPAPITVDTSSDNQSTEELRKSLDFLYATATATRDEPNVQLAFAHVMSRIVLEFEPGDLSALSDIDCYVSGMRLSGTFDPSTGVTEVDETVATSHVYQELTDDNGHTFTALFLPQTLDNGILIEAAMNGIYYQVTVNPGSLQAGYSYRYTVTANDYGTPNALTVTNTQIAPWSEVDGGTLEPVPSLAGTESDASVNDWDTTAEETITPTPVSQ